MKITYTCGNITYTIYHVKLYVVEQNQIIIYAEDYFGKVVKTPIPRKNFRLLCIEDEGGNYDSKRESN